MAVLSFPEFHTTGPIHHWIRTVDSTNIYYLGTAEMTPKMETRRFFTPVFNDIFGPALPGQKLDHGEAATVGVLLTRFSRFTLVAVQIAGQSRGLRTGIGQAGDVSRGSLVFGQQTVQLWQTYDFYGTAQATPGMEPGRFWPQVTLEVHSVESSGTSGDKIMALFDAQPLWTPRQGGTGQKFTLFVSDPSVFPDDVKFPQ